VLSYRPELLILDEPFGGLDLLVRDQVVQSLAALASEQGTTILVSSHDVGEVETLVDRLVWIDHGHLRLNESIESIQQRFREVEVELAGSGASFQPPPGALGFEREGRRIRYVDSRYDLAATPPTASTRRLTLREIYVVSARSSASTPPTVAPSATAAP
jgi:ABC-2 type transport system ATP-binding protein